MAEPSSGGAAAAPATAPPVQSIIVAGDYELVKVKLGSGAFGTVCAVEPPPL